MEHSVQRFLFPYTKIRPVHYKVSGALKTDSFLTAARSLQGMRLPALKMRTSPLFWGAGAPVSKL